MKTRKHTEDCMDANDDTSVLKGECICPKAMHTPGPWHSQNHGKGYMVTSERPVQVIAKTASTLEEKANARLIAAAPELKTALEIVKRGYEPYPGYIMTMVNQAIAKAEGRE